MNLLHICSITNDKTSGISNVVPEHFINQKQLANVALLNCNDIQIDKLEKEKNVFYYNEINKNINNLPEPFNCPDLVIFHGIYILQYITIYKAILKKNIPYIIIPHGSLTKDAQNIKKLKKKLGNFFGFNEFVKNSKSIQYLSNSEMKMSNKFNHNNFIIGNGMSMPAIQKKEFSKECIKLVYVGRYAVYHKGLDILLDGCKIAYDNMIINKIELNLFGSGNDGKDYIKEMVSKRNLEKVVKVNGPIFDNQKLTEIVKNDVFIQTSRLEGQPLGVMEAMSLGMPVIVSEGTTFAGIVQDNECGFVCSTPDEIGILLSSLKLEKEQFIKLGENSRKFAMNTFTWNIIADKSIKKYKELIKDAG